MAVGDGGFKTVAVGGFDKNEVNTYISDVRKKMKSMEEDMKANNKKTEEALKLAEEADDRIKAAEKAGEEKLAEVNKQLSIEQERAVKYKTDLDAAKKELEDERKKMSDMLISGKGVSAEAQKAYTEVIDKAKSDAQVIIDEANEKAAAIIAQAEAERAAVQSNNEKFLEALKAQLDAISASYKTVSESAAELLGTEVAAIEVPVIEAPAAKPSPVEVKAAPAPVEKKAEEPAVEEVAEEPAPVEEAAEEPAPVEEAAEEPAAQPESASDVPAVDAMPAAEPSDELATFDDAWGGNELAQTIYNNEKENAVPLVNPEQKNLFGEDLFKGGEDIKVEELTDDFEPAADDEIVEEIKPLDVSDVAEAAYNDSFDNDLLSQTMPSGSMGDLNESLLETIKAAEEAFAVKPINTDLDMDDVEEEPSSEDDLMKALREAEAALNSMAPAASVSMDDDVEEVTSTDSSSDSSNPWADLQKQLEAMEQSGNVVDDAPAAESKSAAEEKAPADPAAPSADDSSIWNFGSSSDSSDDDMSGDMFGGFGGF